MDKHTDLDPDALHGTPLGVLRPLITDAVLARTCELLGLNDENRTEKLAVLIARYINPSLHLNNETEGILRGIGRKAVGRARARREISPT